MTNPVASREATRRWRERNPQWAKDYYQRNKERYRADRLRNKYRLTTEQFDALMEEQEGRCAICKQPFKDAFRTHIDHDHKTGEVRGLLCLDCNQGIGKLKDSVEILKAAIEYLGDQND